MGLAENSPVRSSLVPLARAGSRLAMLLATQGAVLSEVQPREQVR